jgi:spermidine synthase
MTTKYYTLVPLYKRFLSYVYPVMVNKLEGALSVRLFLFRDQFQLATHDAIYSDGDRYSPAIAIANNLKIFLPTMKNVLMLGSGLGSMVQILHNRGFHPLFTLVEKDRVVLQLSMEIFGVKEFIGIAPVWNDALTFMEQNLEKFDFIFVDIFDSRVVPAFVTTEEFLNLCQKNLKPGGHLAVNYMINYKPDWKIVKQLFTDIFVNHKELNLGRNRIFIV